MGAETSIGIIIAITIMTFFLQSLEIGKQHAPIKLFFNLGSLWALVMGSNIAYQFAINDALSANIISNLQVFYIAVFIIAIFVTIYWMIQFVKHMLKSFAGLLSKKEQSTNDMDV